MGLTLRLLGITTAGLLIVAWSWLDHRVDERLKELDSLREAAARAYEKTLFSLQLALKDLQREQLLQSGEWLQKEASRHFLQGKLEAGQISGLALYDSDCRPLRVVTSLPDAANGELCHSDEDLLTASFGNGIPFVAQRQELSGPGPIKHVVAFVAFDQTWLGGHSWLSQQIERLEAGFEFAAGGQMISIDAEVLPIPLIVSPRLIDHFIQYPARRSYLTNDLVAYFALTMLLLFLWQTLILKRFQKRTNGALQQLQQWLGKVTGGSGGSGPLSVPKLKELIQSKLEEKDAELALLTKKSKLLAARLVQHEDRMQSLSRSKLPDRVKDGLYLQVRQLGDTAAEYTDQVQDANDDALAVVNHSIKTSCKALLTTLQNWQQGIKERGTRKFIRSLAETPGSSNQRALLEEQVDGLIATSSQLATELGNVYMRLADVQTKIKVVDQMIQHWHGLTHYNATQAPISLLTALSEAEKIFRLVHPEALEIKTTAESPNVMLPDGSAALWVSAFYHLLLALKQLGQPGEKLTMVIQNRLKSHQALVIMRPAQGSHVEPQNFKDPTYRHYLELVQKLLEPMAIDVTHLPSTDHIFPVSLSWRNLDLQPAFQKDSTGHDQQGSARQPDLA